MQPSKQLRSLVKAGFVMQDTSLTARCRELGICESNASKTLIGKWDGVEAERLRVRLVQEADLKNLIAVASRYLQQNQSSGE